MPPVSNDSVQLQFDKIEERMDNMQRQMDGYQRQLSDFKDYISKMHESNTQWMQVAISAINESRKEMRDRLNKSTRMMLLFTVSVAALGAYEVLPRFLSLHF